MHHLALPAAAGLLAGAMNAIAGGGSFISFPALVFSGLPSVIANASSTVALFPGSVASAFAFRRDLAGVAGLRLRLLAPISMAGGACGAALLLATPTRVFDEVIPWLLLLAALTFTGGARLGLVLRRLFRIGRRTLLAIQFVISVYGGYFGGAVGLMMMAAWSLATADPDLKSMAPARVVLVSAANGVAVLWFIADGAVRWPEALAMLAGSIIGGYAGACLTRRLPAPAVRGFVILLTWVITALFFLRVY